MIRYILLTLLLFIFQTSFAGTNCQQGKISSDVFVSASDYSISLQKLLNKENSKVAIISRIGSDSSKYGVKYTHAAFAVKQNNIWNVYHLLNECGTSESHIYKQGLLNFYLDDLFTMEIQIIIPAENLQKEIANDLISGKFLPLHNPKYSMLSNPISTLQQNSNQWILESIACSLSGAKNCSRETSQSYLAQTNYESFKIKLNPMEASFGATFKANINFSSYSRKERSANIYPVVTVSSIIDYLHKHNLVQKQIILK